MEPRTASVPIRFGPFEVSPDSGELRKNGTRLKLSGQAIQVLLTLLEKPGQVVTREELQQKLWPGASFGDFEHGINAVIKRLRDVLGDSATEPKFIETIPRRGYRFVGSVASSRPEPARAPEEKPEPEPKPNIITRKLRFVVRRSIWTIAMLAAVIAAAVAYWFMKPPPLPRIVGSHALTHTGYRKAWDEGCCIDQRLLTDGQRVIFQENWFSGARTMQVSRTGGEVSEVLGSSPKIGALRDISKDGSEILDSIVDPKTFTVDAWVHPLIGGPGRLIVKDARSPKWTPDGRTMLFARNDEQSRSKNLYSANSDGSGVRRLAELPGINLLHISPDGHRIRFLSGAGSQFWEASSNGSNPHLLFPPSQGKTLMGDWSPDGKYFFFTRWSGEQHDLWVLPEMKYPWRRASQPVRLTSGPMSIVSPTASKDGNQLYAVAIERHGELAVYDRKAGKFVRYMAGVPVCYVDFSRDGQWIAYVSYPEGSLWRSRIDGSERRQLTVPPMAAINPRWSPDGKFIVFFDIANGDRRRMSASIPPRIFLVSAAGGGPTLLPASGGDPTWSADGRAIAYLFLLPGRPPEIRILNLGSMESSTVPGSQDMVSPRWSPDGKYLEATRHSTLKIYSFASKTWTDVFNGPLVNWPSWSHDSKAIYFEATIPNMSDSLVRVGIEDHKTEAIASLNDVRYTAFYFWNDGWFGLTPDDRPMTTLDTGIEEIYAFDLEYK